MPICQQETAAGRESKLLMDALLYEQGHPRRTRHILSVYALSRLLGEKEGLDTREMQILGAAAILHDIPIKRCKEQYYGDAGQENQRREAPKMVEEFLLQAGYPAAFIPEVLDLVLRHHCYEGNRSKQLGILIEADLLVNCLESGKPEPKAAGFSRLFETNSGKRLFASLMEGQSPALGENPTENGRRR